MASLVQILWSTRRREPAPLGGHRLARSRRGGREELSKIVELWATGHSRPLSGKFVRRRLGANIKRDCVGVRIIDREGRVRRGEADHGENPGAVAEIVRRGLCSLLKGADGRDNEGIGTRLACQRFVNVRARRIRRGPTLGFKLPEAVEPKVRALLDGASARSPLRWSARPELKGAALRGGGRAHRTARQAPSGHQSVDPDRDPAIAGQHSVPGD